MKYLLYVVGGAIAVFLIFFGAGRLARFESALSVREPDLMPQNGKLSLLTEPLDGIAPVLSMIDDAKTKIDLVMYELDDGQIEDALVAAKNRGVAVRIILSGGYYGEPPKVNGQAYQYLVSKGVATQWSPSYFALTHQKTLVTDGDAAMIMTFNLMPQFYSTSRDFAVIDEDPADVRAIESVFEGDWQGNQASAPSAIDLVWSPGSEAETIALIDSATSTLDIYNEEMGDDAVMSALISAAHRGVVVRVDMTYSSEWKSAFQELESAGAYVRTYSSKAPLYIHAKMVLVDRRVALVGSQNFSETSEEENRELGILITDATSLRSLSEIFNVDWSGAVSF